VKNGDSDVDRCQEVGKLTTASEDLELDFSGALDFLDGDVRE
jgi:hypothetical protein